MENIIKKFQETMDVNNLESKNTQLNLNDRKTSSDFITALEEVAEKAGDSLHGFVTELGYGATTEGFLLEEQFGGESRGDDYYVVVQWNNQFWMIPGWYNSQEGGEFHVDDSYEVYPRMTVHIEYVKI